MIKELHKKVVSGESTKHTKNREILDKLLNALRAKELPSDVVNEINQSVNRVNTFTGNSKDEYKLLLKERNSIVKLVEKKAKLVPKNYYRNLWMVLGMTVFGVSFGAAFGAALGNMAFIGIGLPIGMAIGIAIGTAKDKKAAESGKQLDVELK